MCGSLQKNTEHEKKKKTKVKSESCLSLKTKQAQWYMFMTNIFSSINMLLKIDSEFCVDYFIYFKVQVKKSKEQQQNH